MAGCTGTRGGSVGFFVKPFEGRDPEKKALSVGLSEVSNKVKGQGNKSQIRLSASPES